MQATAWYHLGPCSCKSCRVHGIAEARPLTHSPHWDVESRSWDSDDAMCQVRRLEIDCRVVFIAVLDDVTPVVSNGLAVENFV